jgi:DNA-binding transcriptional MerR regulator
MTKVIQADFIKYLECRYGRSLAEAAAHFKCSKRTISRHLEKAELDPEVEVRRIYSATDVMRVLIIPPSGLSSSITRSDISQLRDLRRAGAILANSNGHENLAENLQSLYERLARPLPRATRLSLEPQVNNNP